MSVLGLSHDYQKLSTSRIFAYLRLTLNVWAYSGSSEVRHTTQVAELDTRDLERTLTFWMEGPASHAIDAVVDGLGVSCIGWGW